MKTLVIVALVAAALTACGSSGHTLTFSGASMEPTFRDGQKLKFVGYDGREPALGDIIVFRFPLDPTRDFIKRVIGVPGDTVEVRDGSVFVNGSLLTEDYIKDPPNYTYKPKTVLPNTYWVLGDNRRNSFDSHAWGTSCSPQQLCDFVPKENVIGQYRP